MTGMRELGSVRLSRDTDESTSEERQVEQITLTNQIRGDRLIHMCKDLDVSGSVSPFQRPDLGPWLTEPAKIAQWDVLVVAKLDRLTRSLFDFADLVRWLDKHGKYLISVAESIDLTTAHGRMIANVLVAFAQFERERGGERRREAAAKLRETGKLNGGRPPYGYMRKNGSDLLVQDPDTAYVVRRIVLSFLDGMTAHAICRMLNEDGIPPPRSAPKWQVPTIWRLARSRYLVGELQYKKSTVLDNDGNPVMFTDEPLITAHEWNLLAIALARLAQPHRGQHETSHFLLRVAFCGECDKPLYFQRPHPGKDDTYYRCTAGHGMRMIRADILEPLVASQFLTHFGTDKIMRRVAAGKDYASELTTTEKASADLDEQYFANNLSADRYAKMAARLEKRLCELRVLVQNAAAERWEESGETVAERWERCDKDQRRDMLLRLGIRWHIRRVFRIEDRAWRWIIETNWLPVEEAHERLASLAGSTTHVENATLWPSAA